MPTRLPIHTIGHSTLPLEAFVQRLQAADVALVVDVRSIPRSRTNPQYNKDVLPQALAGFGVAYEHAATLGGRRHAQRNVPPEVNGFWDNASFHNYADYALEPAFHEGFAALRATAQRQRCAIMCAEAVWWRCHRRIIADWLIAAGEVVRHIMLADIEDAKMNPAAQVSSTGVVTYPAAPGLF